MKNIDTGVIKSGLLTMSITWEVPGTRHRFSLYPSKQG